MKGKKMEIKANTRYILNNGSIVTLRSISYGLFGCSGYAGIWSTDGRYVNNGRSNRKLRIKCEEKAMRWVPAKKDDVSVLLLQNPDLSFKKVKNHWFVEISREEAQRRGAEQYAKAVKKNQPAKPKKPGYGTVDLPDGHWFVYTYEHGQLTLEFSSGVFIEGLSF